VAILKDHKFWVGVIVGYLALTVFPQLSFHGLSGMGGKSKPAS
jgi:hypothetical protein